MKRIISILLAAVLFLGMFSCLSGCSENNPVLSRAQWIEMLSSEFGLDESSNTKQAFSDVNSDSSIYNAVQSCVDWGILDNKNSSEFEPEDNAMVNFALDTAVSAADVDLEGKSVEEFAKEEEIIGGAYLDYNGNLTADKADKIIDWAKGLYINKEQKEVENVVLKESVKDISKTVSSVQLSDSAYKVSGSDASDVQINDVIVLPPTKENPSGVARKVVKITKNADDSFTYETEQPSIEEVCTDLEVSTTAVPKKEDIILSDGVSWSNSNVGMSDSSKTENLIPLVLGTEQDDVITTSDKGLDFTMNVNFTKGGALSFSENFANLFKTSYSGGTGKISKDFNSLFGLGEKVTIGGEKGFTAESAIPDSAGELFNKTSIIPDRKLFGSDPYDNTKAIEAYKAGDISIDELKKKLDLTADQHEKKVASMTNKFKGSYEITGTLSINNLYVEPEVKLKKVFGIPTGIEKLGVEVNYEVDSSLTIKGKITEELTVCTCPVAVGATGITVNVKLILFADFNGELTVRAEVDNNTKLEYNNGKFKKTATKSSSLSADLSAQIDFGPGFKVDILFLGIRIIDTKVTAAVRLKFNAGIAYKTGYSVSDEAITIERSTDYTLKFSGYVPIITLSIGQGDSLASKLKLSFSWEIVGEKGALKFDIGEENTPIWQEKLVIKLRDEKEEEKSDEDEQIIDVTDYMKLESYYITLQENGTGTVQITHLPSKYTMADLIWESDKPEVVTVSGGSLNATGYGSAIVSVKTKDGIFACFAVINVQSEKVDFTPLEDSLLNDT